MRFTSVLFIVALICVPAYGQQHVVRNAARPAPLYSLPVLCAAAYAPIPNDLCDVSVYNTSEVDSLLSATKAAANAECKQSIETAQAKLATDINNLPGATLSAMRAEIKEQLRAEILKELLDDIKAGRVKLQSTSAEEAPKK